MSKSDRSGGAQNKRMTRGEALDLYLRGEWDMVMPFDNSLEETFLRRLEKQGWEIKE